jgi:hypothetical protein
MTNSHDQDGRVVFADGQLGAVLVRLDDAIHEDERGSAAVTSGGNVKAVHSIRGIKGLKTRDNHGFNITQLASRDGRLLPFSTSSFLAPA